MERYISMIIGLVGGIFANFLGGYDKIVEVLLTLMILDYVTGVLKGIATKTISSKIGWLGLFKKALILCVVAVSVKIGGIVGDSVPIREIVIIFYISNEGISFLENIAEFIPMPKKLKEIFIQLQEKDQEK